LYSSLAIKRYDHIDSWKALNLTWHALCGKETTTKVVCAHYDKPFTALNISVEFISAAAIKFALQHCADPVVVKQV
jgi:hypothetical protein